MAHPPAMRDLTGSRASVAAHDHAVCAYATEEELLAALATFVHEGAAREDLIVFVHSFPSDDDAWRFVKRAVGDEELRRADVIVVSLYTDAFERGRGSIDHEHVGHVIAGFVQRAADQGRSGTRIFVDASRQYLSSSRGDEWFAFERWLGRSLQAKVALVCAYPREAVMRADVLPRVLETHAYRFDAVE